MKQTSEYNPAFTRNYQCTQALDATSISHWNDHHVMQSCARNFISYSFQSMDSVIGNIPFIRNLFSKPRYF